MDPTATEARSISFRRSLYIVKDMKAGEILSTANIRRIRPGDGLAPKYYDTVRGKRIARDVTRGTPLTWDLIG